MPHAAQHTALAGQAAQKRFTVHYVADMLDMTKCWFLWHAKASPVIHLPSSTRADGRM